MSCMRHSYPKGSIKGQRQCRRCQEWDGEQPAPFDVSQFLGDFVEPAAEPVAQPEGASSVPITVSPVTLSSVALPEHSKLGASSAERWMECPGSVALIEMLGGFESEDPDYRKDGLLQHSLAAYCLEHECDAWEALASGPYTQEMGNAVQVYLDYVNSRPGRREVEVRGHRPELHPNMHGTIDCKLVPVVSDGKIVLEIVDYKGGAGIFVSAVRNPQTMYYAALELFADPEFYPDDGEVRLTIVQPNCYTDEGVIRTWTTTVKDIKDWVSTELLPAMTRASTENYLSLGSWCRFCPAKLACPAMGERAEQMRKHAAEMLTAGDDSALKALSDEVFGRNFVDMQVLRHLLKAYDAEAYRRLMDRRPLAGVKLVHKRVDRVWKTMADNAATEAFKDDAWSKPKLLSPAQMEALPGGKGFVAEWAYKPEAGYTVALDDDTRPGVLPQTAGELHAQAAQKYLDNPSSEG